jgi:galactokinase
MLRLFVPGRLCLFGEHSDWAGAFRETHPALVPGYCLVAGTDQGLYAEAARHDADVVLESVTPDGRRHGPERFPADPGVLAAAAERGGFFSYAAGVVAEVMRRHRIGGLELRIVDTDLPVQKGLSSSAATCVLVARALGRLYDLDLDPRQEMELAYAGERRTGSQCGLMDQVCAFGQRTLQLTFDGARFDVDELPVGAEMALLVVDLCATKDTRRILADLNACYPARDSAVARGVREALGPRNAELTRSARAALAAGDVAGVGGLMTEAQAVFDRLVAPACPELTAPRLHAVLAHPAVRELAWGGKGVGSQGDGCAQLVARDPEARALLARRLEGELGVRCLSLTLRPRPDGA